MNVKCQPARQHYCINTVVCSGPFTLITHYQYLACKPEKIHRFFFGSQNSVSLMNLRNQTYRLRKSSAIKALVRFTHPFGFTSGSSNSSDFGCRAITRRIGFVLLCKYSLLSRPPAQK
jgi:hypothetical protein